MALQTIMLGGRFDDNIKKTNDNFSELQLNKAEKSEIPTKASQLANDSGFQTAQQVADAIAALVDSAPDTLDTLNELAEALGNDPNFAATITNMIAQKVDKVEGKQLSTEDYTTAEKEKLEDLENYVLPVGGEALGGVKNGGNVTINPDGTMTAPAAEQGASVSRIDFTADDPRWGALADTTYTLTAESGGKSPMGVYRKMDSTYAQVMAGITINGASIEVSSYDKFEGYILAI